MVKMLFKKEKIREYVLTVRQYQNWFGEDSPCSGRPIEVNKDKIKAEFVHDHLKGLRLTLKLNIWVPHVLMQTIFRSSR